MSTGKKFATIVLSVLPLTCLADTQGEQPKLSCIKDFTFSQEFLARHPRAGAACREVAIKNGTKWVRFEAEIKKVANHQITADFIDNYNNSVATVTFQASPDASLEVNGSQSRYKELKPGDQLTVWMPENKAGFYAEPGALNNERLSLVSDDSAPR
jgi:hypothetical protein